MSKWSIIQNLNEINKVHLLIKENYDYLQIMNECLLNNIPLNNDLQNLVKVYYEGTLEDWFNLNFSKTSSNPMYYAEEIYFLDENGEYYLVEEICFDSNIIDISNIRGFNCLKRIYLSNKFKEGTTRFFDLSIFITLSLIQKLLSITDFE